MKAPKKIFLQTCGDCPKEDCKRCKFSELEENVTWCRDKIFDTDVEYIASEDSKTDIIFWSIAFFTLGLFIGVVLAVVFVI